jgi:hypothetical protein
LVSYQRGETYIKSYTIFIPRFLWPEKPVTITPINTWFFRNEGGSSPLTMPGEGYFNFGYLGVILAGCVSALLLRFTENFVMRYAAYSVAFAVYVDLLVAVARLHTQTIAVWLGYSLKTCLFVAAAYWLATALQGPTAPEYVPRGER